MKQLSICYKQFKKVGSKITDKEDRKRFYSDMNLKFRLMMHENMHEIPFDYNDELEEYRKQQARYEHQEEEDKIDRVSTFGEECLDELQEALNSITVILANNPIDDLSKEVRKEVAEIRKALPPKTVGIAKESLEQLRHSDQLSLDLEQISEIMQTVHSFFGSDGKLKKINKKLDHLRLLLEEAIKEERERKTEIEKGHDEVERKIDYATKAVRTYGSILDNNTELEQEQIRIRDNRHGLQDENDRLDENIKKSYDEVEQIKSKPEHLKILDDSVRVEKLYERVEEESETIRENKEYLAKKTRESKVTQLPPQYTDMKKKLKNMSSLYQMEQSQDLLTGGMSI